MSVREAMVELGIPADAPPEKRFSAVCKWVLGNEAWASSIRGWLKESGYILVEEHLIRCRECGELSDVLVGGFCENCM